MFDTGEVREIGAGLLASEDGSRTPTEQIDRIAGWERLIAHAHAQQLAEMATFAACRRSGSVEEPGSTRVWWTTPTGHTYASDPPPAIGYGTLSHRLLRHIVRTGQHGLSRRRTAA